MTGCGLVEHNAIGPLEGKGMGSVDNQWGEKVVDEVRGHVVHPLPNPIRDRVRP